MVKRVASKKPRYLFGFFLALVVLLSGADISAQVEVSPGQRYLLLATTRTSTMQEELGEAADLGFRIVAGSPTSGDEMALFLERVATPPDTYEYLVLATSRTITMQEEVQEAAARGFRLLPRTLISKSQVFGDDEVVVVLERRPNGGGPRYEYRLLATTLTSTLQDEVTRAIAGGFAIAGLVSRNEHMVILEREVP